MNTPSTPPSPPPIPPRNTTPPLPPDAGFAVILDALLKRPVQLIQYLCETKSSRPAVLFTLAAVVAFALYGLVIGTFCGGLQVLAAPLKTSLGGLFCAAICFPSLYIFTCLSGADVSLRGAAGVLAAIFALTGLLLLGLAPVAWVFSQSTESTAFIGTLHLIFWFIAAAFGLYLLEHMTRVLHVAEGSHLKVWGAIYILVCMQMTTALRPIIGPYQGHLPTEKKFFASYWWENISKDITNEPAR
jgi:hypothetical protein